MYEVEYKIIGTALMVEQDLRDRIFREIQPEFFEDKTTAEIFGRLSAVYDRYPTADYATYTATLDLDQQDEIKNAMESMISPVIAAERFDETLTAFRERWQQRQLKTQISGLAFADPTAADVLQLAEMVKGFPPNGLTTRRNISKTIMRLSRSSAQGFRSWTSCSGAA